jgi:hypothetical protein
VPLGAGISPVARRNGMDPTRPSRETRETESDDARRPAGADRMPTEDEERLADRNDLDPDVVEHEEEMTDLGAGQEGEGRIP